MDSTYSPTETFYLYPSDIADNSLFLTTHPEHTLSWNTAFNAGVWSIGGAALFSSLGLASYGATIAMGSYALVVTFNGIKEKGIPGFLQGLWDDVTNTHDLTPEQREFIVWFYNKYGISWQEASSQFRKLFPEDTVGWAFEEWCDKTFLPIPLFNKGGFDTESKRLYGMTIQQAMGLFRKQQPDWKKYESEIGTDGRTGTGPHTFYYWIEKQKEFHALHPNTSYPVNWREYSASPPIRPNNFILRNEDSDVSPLLLLLGGTVVGEFTGHPLVGASLGTAAAIYYKKRKHTSADVLPPAKRLKLTDEQRESIHYKIIDLRKQLEQVTDEEQRAFLEKEIEDLTSYETDF